jgi:hypothetical protein
MFVSYAFSVACFAVGGVATYYLFNDPAVWVYVLMVTGFVLVTAPLTLRYSRAIMLYLFGFIHFDPKYSKRRQLEEGQKPAKQKSPLNAIA